jgi:hypothetical protein
MQLFKTKKRVEKGQSVIDLQAQIFDSVNIINSASLNIQQTCENLKIDPDFTLDEIQEFKNILLSTNEKLKTLSKTVQTIYDEIILQ